MCVINLIFHFRATIQLLLVEFLGVLFVCGVLQVWPEKFEMVILLCFVLHLLQIKRVSLFRDRRECEVCIFELQVVEHAAGNFMADHDEALTCSS